MSHHKRKENSPSRIISEGIMIIGSLLVLFPVIYQIIASFKNKADVNRPLSFPTYFYLNNFKDAIVDGSLLVLLKNSLIVALLSIMLIIILGSLASYSIVRSRNKIYTYLYYFFLSGIMIPFQSGMIPLYKLIKSLGLIDNILSIVLVSTATCIPMSVLIFTGFIKSVPVQLRNLLRLMAVVL